jgi:hypothetical protein
MYRDVERLDRKRKARNGEKKDGGSQISNWNFTFFLRDPLVKC